MHNYKDDMISPTEVETGLLASFNMIVGKNRDERISPYISAGYADKATRVVNAIVNNRRQAIHENAAEAFDWDTLLNGLNALFTASMECAKDEKLSMKEKSKYTRKAARVANSIVNARKQQLWEVGKLDQPLTDFKWSVIQKGVEGIFNGSIAAATSERLSGKIRAIYSEKAANLTNSLVGIRRQRALEAKHVAKRPSKKVGL